MPDAPGPGAGPRAHLGALADRLGVGPGSLLVGVAAVAAAGLAAWWALRAPDPPPVESLLPQVDSVTVPTPPPTSTTTIVVVHVDGEVRQPGVHEVVAGSRVVDAIAAAGGLTDGADRAAINLAAPVSDGERLWVPAVGEIEPPVQVGRAPAGDGADGTGPVDLNRADEAELETLPGIGPALAAAIVESRERDGPFLEPRDLLRVSGIGPAKLAVLEDLVVT